MKNILFTIFAAAITFASCNDNAENNPEKEIILKLTKVEEEQTDFNEKGETQNKESKVDVYAYHKNGYVSSITTGKESKIVFTYNSDNQLTEKAEYEYDSEKKEISSKASTTYKYIYNKEGLITSEEKYKTTSEGTPTISKTTSYTYNNEKLLITKIVKSNNSYENDEQHYEYDSNKNMVKGYSKDKNKDYFTLAYDTKRNPFSVIYPKAYCLIKFNLGPHNRTSYNEYSDANTSDNQSSIVYKYNNAGYPTESEMKHTGENDKVKELYKTKFTYEQEKKS